MPAARARRLASVLVDTNVVLDVILRREPWADDAVRMLDAVSRGRVRGFVASHAITTVHYVVAKDAGRAAANTAVADLLAVLRTVPLGEAEYHRALAMRLGDFEDAVQAAASLAVGADFVVTRNAKDFRGAPVATRTPGEILAMLR